MVAEMKKKTVKALLIDPENEEVKEIELTRGDGGSILRELYRVIGCGLVDVMRDCVIANGKLKNDDIWVDDMALDNPTHFFRIAPWWTEHMEGRAVILGHDDDGESTDHSLTPEDLEDLRKHIKFANIEDFRRGTKIPCINGQEG